RRNRSGAGWRIPVLADRDDVRRTPLHLLGPADRRAWHSIARHDRGRARRGSRAGLDQCVGALTASLTGDSYRRLATAAFGRLSAMRLASGSGGSDPDNETARSFSPTIARTSAFPL